MIPARIELDFAPPRRRFPLLGTLTVLVAAAVCAQVVLDFRDTQVATELASMSIARYERNRSASTAAAERVDPRDVTAATATLLTPWSQLLVDLEAAAGDTDKDVALLEISPDKVKQRVSIAGEARTLDHVLSYVTRLQHTESIRHPLLQNHEIQESAQDRPVRFVIQAEWRLLQ